MLHICSPSGFLHWANHWVVAYFSVSQKIVLEDFPFVFTEFHWIKVHSQTIKSYSQLCHLSLSHCRYCAIFWCGHLVFSYHVSHSYVTECAYMMCATIRKCLMVSHLPKLRTEDHKVVAQGFRQQQNFPNCPGALNKKTSSQKTSTTTLWMSVLLLQEDFLILFAQVNADYWFRVIQVGDFGPSSCGNVNAGSVLEWKDVPLVKVIDERLLKNLTLDKTSLSRRGFWLQTFKSDDSCWKRFWHSGFQMKDFPRQDQPPPQTCGHTGDGSFHPP